MKLNEKTVNTQNQVINNLSEISLENLLEYNFDNSLFNDISSLEKLDEYIKLSFVSYAESNDKDKILLLTKVIIRSLGLLIRHYENDPDTNKLKIRWEYLGELCSYYLEAKSYKSSYDAIRKNDKALQIIAYLYENNIREISDLIKLFDTSKQNIFHLISELEGLGIVMKRIWGKNTSISLSMIGIEIYEEYINPKREGFEILREKIQKEFPDQNIHDHLKIPVLSYT